MFGISRTIFIYSASLKFYSAVLGFSEEVLGCARFSGFKNKKPRRLEPRGWSLDGCILEKLNKIPKGLNTEYKQAGKAWAQYVQDNAQYVQD